MNLLEVIKPGMKAAFYGRHSTNKQIIDTQIRGAYDFAKKYDVEIVGEYTDKGVSSRKKFRKGLKDLIKDASAGKFDFVIVYKHSRLARIPEDHQVLRITFDALGMDIVECFTETIYNRAPIISSAVKDALAKYELDKIRLFTKDTIKTLAEKGLWTGGPAPFGYKYFSKYPRQKNKDGKRVESNTYKEIISKVPKDMKTSIKNGKFEKIESELMLVNEVFSLYKSGYGFHSIASKMPRKSFRGKDWDKDKVKQIVINPFYAGYIAIRKRNLESKNSTNDRKEWIMTKSDLIEPIISYSKWEHCFHLYESRKNKKIPPNYFNTNFWLSNLLYCKVCNSEMKGKDQCSNGYGRKFYFCPVCCEANKSKKCKYPVSYNVSEVHEQIGRYLTGLHSKNIDEIVNVIQKKIEIQYQEINEQIDRLRFAVLEEEKKLVSINSKKREIFANLNEKDDIMKVKYLEVLTIAEDQLKESINEKSERIKKLQESIISLQNIDANREHIQEEVKDLYNIKGLPNVSIRRLFLYLFESIFIDPNQKLDVKLRMDLKKVS